MITRIQLTVY